MKTKTILGVLPIAAVVAAGYFFPPVRLFGMKIVGRSPYCPMKNALAADRNLQSQIQWNGEILKASKVVEKDPAGYHLVETPRGTWWIPEGNDYVLPFNLAEQAREVYGSGEYAVKPGDTVLDCGANVGVWTRTALDRGARLVVAFEPAPENIESYRRNFKKEIAEGRVVLVPKGVWDKDDILLLKRDPHNSAADSFIMLADGTPGVQAPLTTIDKAVAELKLERVDYIKMDIEGAETRALVGSTETIAKFHPHLSIAMEHSPEDGLKIPVVVLKIWSGYRVVCGPCLETTDGRVRPDVLYFE
ncbi:MAG TPA: FkbM family methyltransferase [Bryobacteraceae bacterium]|jgi:FkbM family methyltransferase|nr:FkbM family methyltransferase [Bryobacteraceae bacterium]